MACQRTLKNAEESTLTRKGAWGVPIPWAGKQKRQSTNSTTWRSPWSHHGGHHGQEGVENLIRSLCKAWPGTMCEAMCKAICKATSGISLLKNSLTEHSLQSNRAGAME